MTKKPRMGRPPRSEPAERLVTYLPVPLKRQLEHRAVDERKSLSDLVTEAVRAFLHRSRRS